jgi:hypothetical protein
MGFMRLKDSIYSALVITAMAFLLLGNAAFPAGLLGRSPIGLHLIVYRP